MTGRSIGSRLRSPTLSFLAIAALLIALIVAAAVLLYDSPASAPSAGGRGAVVWAVGDGADGGDAAKEVAGLIAQSDPDRLLYLGDVYEQGTAAEFESGYAPVYGQFAKITAPTPGNHEWGNAEEGYFPYWQGVTGREQPAYYAFQLAGWEILSLNSEGEHAAGSPQVRWLADQLSESGTCRIAFWHTPRYSAGTTHGDDPGLEPFWRALRGHASVIVNAHDHDMQRLDPIDGITQFVSGAGGHKLYSIDSTDPRLAFGNDATFGALRLELEPRLARYAFVAADGRTLDSGTVPCRPLREARRG